MAATKNWITNYTFFVNSFAEQINGLFFMIETNALKELNQHVLSKQEGNGKMLKSSLTISDKHLHSVNLFYCKTYSRGVLRTQSNIYNKAFLWFLQRSSTIEVWLGSKYACAYICIQLRSIEIISILHIFAVKYTFSDKRRIK